MNLLSRNGRTYRSAKLEHTNVEEYSEYLYDDNGELVLNPETGEPEVAVKKVKTTLFTGFKYNLVNQATLEKTQYITNVWNQDANFTIKTFDPIDPAITDRVIIDDKAYNIVNIYKDFDDSTAGMFGSLGYYVTYIGLKGTVTL